MIEYALYDFEFDGDRFSEQIGRVTKQYSARFVADLLEVDVSTVSNWKTKAYVSTDFPFPSMSNFLVFCNEFDLDPRAFF